MKGISISVAFAVWMGYRLLGFRFIEIYLLKQSISFKGFFFIRLIIVAIVGLKKADRSWILIVFTGPWFFEGGRSGIK